VIEETAEGKVQKKVFKGKSPLQGGPGGKSRKGIRKGGPRMDGRGIRTRKIGKKKRDSRKNCRTPINQPRVAMRKKEGAGSHGGSEGGEVGRGSRKEKNGKKLGKKRA